MGFKHTLINEGGEKEMQCRGGRGKPSALGNNRHLPSGFCAFGDR